MSLSLDGAVDGLQEGYGSMELLEDESDEDEGEGLEGEEGEEEENDDAVMTEWEMLAALDQNDLDDNQVGEDSGVNAEDFASTTPARELPAWNMVGVDPINPQVDEPGVPSLLEADEHYGLSCVHVSTPLLGCVTGRQPVFGVNGEELTYPYPDLSHMGVGWRHIGGLISLPRLYTDLFRSTKSPQWINSEVDEPAICLVCGQVVAAGNHLTRPSRGAKRIGECTLHAQRCGAGIGVFYLVQRATALLVKNSLACYYPSMYVDCHGEVDKMLSRNKPLYLSEKRYAKLEAIYMSHEVAKEVVRVRASAERILHPNWF